MSEENAKLLKSVGLKVTEPRLTILALMQQHREQMQHFSAEDIYKILLEHGSDIGLATVYRVLNQFEEVVFYFAITLMRIKRYSSLT
ncbi:ferric uptake regulation protein [Actinobacillus pleuropneumoniae]|nr:ferric uptake regulation protein [Actinobacillus pleuropneumoniae]